MKMVRVRAAAKINLLLGVGPARTDGYHRLATVYHAIGMYDDVLVTDAETWSLRLSAHDRIDMTEIPTGDGNIALKAARLLTAHHGLHKAADILVNKSIPVAGGLAGGSADAAATLVALDRLWDLNTSDEDLLHLAARLGSDVPFALIGGTARGDGHGEIVTPVEDNGSWWWVVVESDQGLSTPRIYAKYDELNPDGVPDPMIDEALLEALRAGDADALAASLRNDLQASALHVRPALGDTLKVGEDAGALRGIVSGSGPTCVFLCADRPAADQVREAFLDAGYSRVQAVPSPVAGTHEVIF